MSERNPETLEDVQRRRDTAAAAIEAKLLESMLWDGFGGSDLFYDIQRQKYGGNEWVPISVVTDRKDGANFPIFRNEIELAQYRQKSRIVCQKNAYAISTLGNLANYSIGKGFTYRVQAKKDRDTSPAAGVQLDQADKAIVAAGQKFVDEFLSRNRWTATVNPSADQTVIAQAREREACIRVNRDGEAILRLFHLEDGKTAVRFVEPEQVTDPPHKDAGGWSYGMRHCTEPFEDEETIEEFYVKYKDPAGRDTAGELVPASEIVHIKPIGQDATIKRGLPLFSLDTLDAFERAAKLQRNISVSSSVRAARAEVWQHEMASESQVSSLAQKLAERVVTNPLSGQTALQERLAPGTIARIPAGMKPLWPQAVGASEHIEVAQGDLRQAVAAFNAPEYFTGDASNANYASTKEAGAPFVLSAEVVQDHYKISYAVVVLKAIRHGVEKGLLPPNFLEVCELQVETPAIAVRDPLQKAQEDQILTAIKVKSPQTCQMERALDPDHEAANFEEFDQRFGGGGNPLAAMMGGGNPPGNPLGESLVESALLEAGFSGQITDKAGHKRTYVDGRQVANAGGGDGGDPPAGKADPGKAAESWAALATKIPGKIYEAAKNKVQEKYAQLTERYGRKFAIAIMGAGIAGLPLPIPGSSVITAAPVIALAEAYRYFSSAGHVTESIEELTPEEIEQLGKQLIAELLDDESAAVTVESLEADLLEAGFSGTITDKLGRKLYYQNGKRVKNPNAPAPKAKDPATQTDAQYRRQQLGAARVSAAHDRIDEILSGGGHAEAHKELLNHLATLTVDQLKGIRDKYKFQASAKLKKNLVAKLAGNVAAFAKTPAEVEAADFANNIRRIRYGEEHRGTAWVEKVMKGMEVPGNPEGVGYSTPYQERWDKLRKGEVSDETLGHILGMESFKTDYGTLTIPQFKRVLPYLRWTGTHANLLPGSDAAAPTRGGMITADVVAKATAAASPAKAPDKKGAGTFRVGKPLGAKLPPPVQPEKVDKDLAKNLDRIRTGERLRGTPWIDHFLTALEAKPETGVSEKMPLEQRWERLKDGKISSAALGQVLGMEGFRHDYGTLTVGQLKKVLPHLQFTMQHTNDMSHGDAQHRTRSGMMTDDVVARAFKRMAAKGAA